MLQKTYQEFYRIYGKPEYHYSFNPDVVIVEDSNSGYEFFAHILEGKDQGFLFEVYEGKT